MTIKQIMTGFIAAIIVVLIILFGFTSNAKAAEVGDTTMVKTMCMANPDGTPMFPDQWTVLQTALMENDHELYKSFIDHVEVACVDLPRMRLAPLPYTYTTLIERSKEGVEGHPNICVEWWHMTTTDPRYPPDVVSWVTFNCDTPT